MRSMVATANGGRPALPAGAYGVISATNSVHGITRLVSPRNSRLRVLLWASPNPEVARLVCFIIQ